MAIHAGVEESNQSTLTDEDHHSLVSVHAALGSSRHLGLSSRRLSLHNSDLHAVRVSRCTKFLAHPFMRHVRAIASLVAVMALWEGIWDAAFTADAEHAGWQRMFVYTMVGLLGLMLTNSLFSNSGVIAPFSISKRGLEVQRKLGFYLQEKRFERAGAGGFAHDESMQQQQQQSTSGSSHPVRLGSDDLLSPPFIALRSDDSVRDQASPGVPYPVPSPPRDSAFALGESKEPFREMHD